MVEIGLQVMTSLEFHYWAQKGILTSGPNPETFRGWTFPSGVQGRAPMGAWRGSPIS